MIDVKKILKDQDEKIAILKQAEKSTQELNLKEAFSKGWIEGYNKGIKTAIQIHCKHKTEDRESVCNEDEAWSICTACGKDMTPSFLDEMDAKYDSGSQLPF